MKKILSIMLVLSEESLEHLNLRKRRVLISTLALVTANLIPVAGIMFLDWNPATLLFSTGLKAPSLVY